MKYQKMVTVKVVICSFLGQEFIVHVAVVNLEGDHEQQQNQVQLIIENLRDSCTNESRHTQDQEEVQCCLR